MDSYKEKAFRDLYKPMFDNEEKYKIFERMVLPDLLKPLTEEEEKELEKEIAEEEERLRLGLPEPYKKMPEKNLFDVDINYFDYLLRFPNCKNSDEFLEMVNQEHLNLKKQSEEKKHFEVGYNCLRYGFPKTWSKLEKNVEMKQKQFSQNVKENAKCGDHFSHGVGMAFTRKKPLVDKMYQYARQFRRFSLR